MFEHRQLTFWLASLAHWNVRFSDYITQRAGKQTELPKYSRSFLYANFSEKLLFPQLWLNSLGLWRSCSWEQTRVALIWMVQCWISGLGIQRTQWNLSHKHIWPYTAAVLFHWGYKLGLGTNLQREKPDISPNWKEN